MDISCTVANYDRQSNFECDFEGKSLHDAAVNCASIDFLLHVITNNPSPKRRSNHENSGSKVRAHLAAIGCNGLKVLATHLWCHVEPVYFFHFWVLIGRAKSVLSSMTNFLLSFFSLAHRPGTAFSQQTCAVYSSLL